MYVSCRTCLEKSSNIYLSPSPRHLPSLLVIFAKSGRSDLAFKILTQGTLPHPWVIFVKPEGLGFCPLGSYLMSLSSSIGHFREVWGIGSRLNPLSTIINWNWAHLGVLAILVSKNQGNLCRHARMDWPNLAISNTYLLHTGHFQLLSFNGNDGIYGINLLSCKNFCTANGLINTFPFSSVVGQHPNLNFLHIVAFWQIWERTSTC